MPKLKIMGKCKWRNTFFWPYQNLVDAFESCVSSRFILLQRAPRLKIHTVIHVLCPCISQRAQHRHTWSRFEERRVKSTSAIIFGTSYKKAPWCITHCGADVFSVFFCVFLAELDQKISGQNRSVMPFCPHCVLRNLLEVIWWGAGAFYMTWALHWTLPLKNSL